MKSEKAIPSIDIAKFIFSICIVVLHSAAHTELPGILPYVVEKVVLRIPVPFFFVVSGLSVISQFSGISVIQLSAIGA